MAEPRTGRLVLSTALYTYKTAIIRLPQHGAQITHYGHNTVTNRYIYETRGGAAEFFFGGGGGGILEGEVAVRARPFGNDRSLGRRSRRVRTEAASRPVLARARRAGGGGGAAPGDGTGSVWSVTSRDGLSSRDPPPPRPAVIDCQRGGGGHELEQPTHQLAVTAMDESITLVGLPWRPAARVAGCGQEWISRQPGPAGTGRSQSPLVDTQSRNKLTDVKLYSKLKTGPEVLKIG